MAKHSQSYAQWAESSKPARSASPVVPQVTVQAVLHRTDRTTLYRAVRSDGSPVILKVLSSPSAADIERLANEQDVTCRLKSRGVLRLLTMMTYEGCRASLPLVIPRFPSLGLAARSGS